MKSYLETKKYKVEVELLADATAATIIKPGIDPLYLVTAYTWVIATPLDGGKELSFPLKMTGECSSLDASFGELSDYIDMKEELKFLDHISS